MKPSNPAVHRDDRLVRARRIFQYGLAVVFGPLVLLVSWSAIARVQALPRLSRAEFDAARELWADTGPADYNVEIVVEGRQPATYRAEVRGGRVQAAFRNSRPLTQPRTMGTWSVPGMFATMESDVERVAKAEHGAADPSLPPLMLRARFDSTYGYPARYHRTEAVRHGANPAVSWRVTEFEDLTPMRSDSGN